MKSLIHRLISWWRDDFDVDSIMLDHLDMLEFGGDE